MLRLALVLLLLPFALAADTAQVHERVSLEVGTVNVWLGMTQEEAAKKFQEAGYKVIFAGDQLLLKRDMKNDTEGHVLWFKAGQLAFADREWNTKVKADIDAVIGALGELAEKSKNESCYITHSPISSPDSSSNRIFVSCGQRSVLIGKGTITGMAFESISERIGDMPTKEE